MSPPRPHMPHEVPRSARALAGALPSGPAAKTGVCTTAVLLISVAGANIVYGMQGGAIEAPRAIWTAVGLLGGAGLIYLGHCHALLYGPGGR